MPGDITLCGGVSRRGEAHRTAQRGQIIVIYTQHKDVRGHPTIGIACSKQFQADILAPLKQLVIEQRDLQGSLGLPGSELQAALGIGACKGIIHTAFGPTADIDRQPEGLVGRRVCTHGEFYHGIGLQPHLAPLCKAHLGQILIHNGIGPGSGHHRRVTTVTCLPSRRQQGNLYTLIRFTVHITQNGDRNGIFGKTGSAPNLQAVDIFRLQTE